MIALLMNPDNPNAAAEQRDAQEAARVLKHQTLILNVRNKNEFGTAFETFVRARAGALYVASDPMLLSQRDLLVEFAECRKIPAIYFVREFVMAGGLLSYGASIRNMYREADKPCHVHYRRRNEVHESPRACRGEIGREPARSLLESPPASSQFGIPR